MNKIASIMMLAAIVGGAMAPSMSFAKERSHKHRSTHKATRAIAGKRGEKSKRVSARNVNRKAAKTAKAPSNPASISG